MISNKTRHNFNISLLFRLILGGIFIYSGIFKVLNAEIFEKALQNYSIIPSVMVKIISISFPWLEIIVGVFLVLKIWIKCTAVFTSLLLLAFVAFTIRGVFIGMSGGCGCFPENSILNSGNPIIIIIRNFILLMMAIFLFVNKDVYKNAKPKYYDKLIIYLPIIILISFCISALLVVIGKKQYEYFYITSNLSDRQIIINKINEINIKDIESINMDAFDDKYEINKSKYKIYIFLLLTNFDCNLCLEEAMYLEKVQNNYRENVIVFAIVGSIGKTAISNIKSKYGLTYEFKESLSKEIFKKYSFAKTIKLLIDVKGNVINIEPVTYNIKALQHEFENVLINNIKRGGGIID